MKNMRKHTLFSLLVLVLVLFSACSAPSGDVNTPPSDEPAANIGTVNTDGAIRIQIDVKDYGLIEAELYPMVAPETVANFTTLISDGFYDGLTFHRTINTFMIQGGDPLGNGKGNSGTTISGEFANNGFSNDLSHARGVLSMARGGKDMNSASCQFFIVQQDATFLDGDYAAFGLVTSGMDIIDSIALNTPVEDDNGTVLPENQPIINSIVIVE
jgi:peptidyl-prolyl cis-trans isomerase B (cyclophilin B)